MGTPSHLPIYKIKPHGYQRSLGAHRSCVGVKNYVIYYGSLILLEFVYFLFFYFGELFLGTPFHSLMHKIEPQGHKRSFAAHRISKMPEIKRTPR